MPALDNKSTFEELAGGGKVRRFDEIIDDEEHEEIQGICRRSGEAILLARLNRTFCLGDRNRFAQEARRFDQQEKARILNTDQFCTNLAGAEC